MEAEYCPACQGKLKKDLVELEDIENGKVVKMKDVEAMVCEQCGEIWVPEPIIKEFEKLLDAAAKRPLKKNKKGRKKNA